MRRPDHAGGRVLDAIGGQQSLGGLDIAVRRNAFGNQMDSFETDISMPELGEAARARGVHPRAGGRDAGRARPRPRRRLPTAGWSRSSRATCSERSFHPEMTDEYRFHARFLDSVARRLT